MRGMQGYAGVWHNCQSRICDCACICVRCPSPLVAKYEGQDQRTRRHHQGELWDEYMLHFLLTILRSTIAALLQRLYESNRLDRCERTEQPRYNKYNTAQPQLEDRRFVREAPCPTGLARSNKMLTCPLSMPRVAITTLPYNTLPSFW